MGTTVLAHFSFSWRAAYQPAIESGARRCVTSSGMSQGRRARWRFSLGCAWAAVLIRLRALVRRPAPGTASSRFFVFAGIAAALCLAAYGLLHYPGLRSDSSTWVSVAFFLAFLAGYALSALALSTEDSHGGVASRYGVAGGLVIGSAWFVILAPTNLLKSWVAFPLVLVLLGPACIAALAGRSAKDARTGIQAALWSGLVGGLTAFVIWVTATYLRDGRPYDPGLLRDFHQSGADDLATYAVSDNLGTGLVLLVIVPIVAVALGSLTARLVARENRATSTGTR